MVDASEFRGGDIEELPDVEEQSLSPLRRSFNKFDDAVHSLGRWVDPAFIRFVIVGSSGFVTDGALLTLLVNVIGTDAIHARYISFPTAVVITWFLNRVWTFKGRKAKSNTRQISTYFLVQLTGGAINFGVYAALIKIFPILAAYPLLPLVAGSIAGMGVNYFGSKYIAFKHHE